MKKNLPSPDAFVNEKISRYPQYVIREHVGSGANGHVFRAYNSMTKSSLAFKIIPFSNLPENVHDNDAYLNEARIANVLAHRSVVRHHDIFTYLKDGESYIVFVCDYVDGINLRKYMQQRTSEVNVQFIEAFLQTMFQLLFELKSRGLSHGDLHAGNILVAKSEYSMEDLPEFRVTDFGIQQFSEQPTDESDYLSLAKILRLLLECIEYMDCQPVDRYVYDRLRNDFLQRHLIETDSSADPFAYDPEKMSRKIATMREKYRKEGQNVQSPRLATPFDYPNCEQMGNSHLLLKNLYSDRFLGLSKICARSNLVLTGPRGCGKTTIFKALSLDHRISTDEDIPDVVQYIGIYYRCEDLYFAFPRYRRSDRIEAIDIPMHYLIATLLSSLLDQLSMWAKKHFRDEFEDRETNLVSGLWRIFGLNQPNIPNAYRLETLVNRLHKERKRSADKQRFVHVLDTPIGEYFQPGVMVESCRYIRDTLSFLNMRPFYFFIDDYSSPKITMALQENLNRLIMFRSSDIFFKVSTESPVSFAREDIDGKKFAETREYDLVNLGLRYLISSIDQGRKFLEDLFQRRFNEVEEYPVKDLEELLGTFPRNENETARYFRKKEKKKKKKIENHNYYAGCQTLAVICSGDIHYMIRLVEDMVEDCGGIGFLEKSTNIPKIPPNMQENSIRKAAGNFMETIKVFPGIGPHLADVINAFGNVARSYLLYRTSSNGKGKPPHQASRIELYDALAISDKAQKTLDELLRYSVLIEDPRGKSRRGKVVPRYYLRRYLIPHFLLTFSRRDSIQLENSELDTLLCDPNEFDRAMRLRSSRDARQRRRSGTANSDQGNLF